MLLPLGVNELTLIATDGQAPRSCPLSGGRSGCISWSVPACFSHPQRLEMHAQLVGDPFDRPTCRRRSRLASTVERVAHSRNSSGYFRGAAMTVNLPGLRCLPQSRDGIAPIAEMVHVPVLRPAAARPTRHRGSACRVDGSGSEHSATCPDRQVSGAMPFAPIPPIFEASHNLAAST